jgi:hypothetical protein
MSDVFTFESISTLDSSVVREIVGRMRPDELAKALIREDAKIRKKFYRHMSLNALWGLDEDLMNLDNFPVQEKKAAQRKMLSIIAEIPEYHDARFEDGFDSIEDFEAFLKKRNQPENPYGIFDADTTMCRFFDSKNGENLLADIEKKNEEQGMGNIPIPHTNIRLINYSICPQCGHIFSFKDLADYYANPKPDTRFKNRANQFREDTRVCCTECSSYFLPALVIADGTPKNEVQFLCRVQTMNAIERFYLNKGIKVLSLNEENIIKREGPETVRTERKVKEPAAPVTFVNRLFHPKAAGPGKTVNKHTITGIRNDVLLKEMEAKPALISNLIQYTPSNLVFNLRNCQIIT